MPDSQPRHDGPATKLLYVEGDDDYHVIGQLLGHHGSGHICSLKKGDGIETMLASLDSYLMVATDGLGLVLDADAAESQENAVLRRWQSVADKLRRSGYSNVPAGPDPAGTIIPAPTDDLPPVGIWLMPDNTVGGQLEHFLQLLIPQGDRLWERARKAVQAIPTRERRFTEKQRPKAEVHTWLAWQKEPGKPFGLSIKANYFDADAPQAQRLIAWLRALFITDET